MHRPDWSPPLPRPLTIPTVMKLSTLADVNGFAVSYVYFEDEPGRRAAANLMTKDEARRVVVILPASSQAQFHCARRDDMWR
jgi:hypothetical protein